jgi:LTXXQ motif family protein
VRAPPFIYFTAKTQSESKEFCMIKPVIAAMAFVALAGSSFAYAQYGFGGGRAFGDGGPRAEHRHRMSAADVSAFADARIAALKAGLELNTDQAKNWPPFEQAVRDLVQMRIQRLEARQAGDQKEPATPFDRLARRADNMAKTSFALKKVADAGAPLYQSLNDEQKNRFVVLARILRPHHHMRGEDEHGWRDGRNGFGGERFGQGYGRGFDGQRSRFMQDSTGGTTVIEKSQEKSQ